MKYYNYKTGYGVETVDQIDQKDFIWYKEYRQELRRLLNEYRLAGMNVYVSSRSTKDWREK
jgi:hypothetical protein